MRRFLQFLFTVAMGAALLYLFAGNHNRGNSSSRNTATESAPSQDTLAAMPQADSNPDGERKDGPDLKDGPASQFPIDTITEGTPDSAGVRTAEAILSVIRKQTPTLRFIYNQALRTRPGMQGKIVFKLRIAPSGRLAEVTLVSSTTQDDAFDKAVAAKVETWRFQSISNGKDDIVTVPFTFSE